MRLFLSLPRLAALVLVPAVAAALPGALLADQGPAYLVKDIDTTGEPVVITYDPCPGFCPPPDYLYGGYPSQLTAVGDVVYFEADDHVHGGELWVSDGTAPGTRMVADLCPGDCGSWPRIIGGLGGELLFWADDGTHGGELWVTDGSAGGTVLLADVCPGACSGYAVGSGNLGTLDPLPSGSLGGVLFFEAQPDPEDGSGRDRQLWRSDGTPAGTEEVLDFCPGASCGTGAVAFARLPGVLLVGQGRGADGVAGLWRITGPTEPPEVVDASLGVESEKLLTIGTPPRAVFVGRTFPGGPEPPFRDDLYRTDGTPAGTELIRHGGGATLVSLRGKVYFLVYEADNRVAFWKTDGTAAGTSLAWRIPKPIADVFAVVPFAGELFFEGLDYDTLATSLWRTTGGVSAGVDTGIQSVGPYRVAGGRLYFRGGDSVHGVEPWVTDGTAEGTRLVQDINPGPGRSFALFGPVAGHRLFFPAEDGVHDRELWALPVPENGGPPTPDAPPITSAEFPGFRFWVRIDSPGSPPRIGARAASCLPETVCVTGALPSRIEVFLRIVGPKPNGRLWPTIVKFSTSEVEVWIEQTATGALRYYDLAGARPGVDELPGLFDREGFAPR